MSRHTRCRQLGLGRGGRLDPAARRAGDQPVLRPAVQRLGALRIFSEVDDALADADGAVRKEFRMSGERRRQIHLTLVLVRQSWHV
jgi:hypothetical protein